MTMIDDYDYDYEEEDPTDALVVENDALRAEVERLRAAVPPAPTPQGPPPATPSVDQLRSNALAAGDAESFWRAASEWNAAQGAPEPTGEGRSPEALAAAHAHVMEATGQGDFWRRAAEAGLVNPTSPLPPEAAGW